MRTLAEEVHHLPGLSFSPNFRHFSGFLQVSDTHFLHYWFVESQNDPATDPLIFWFNGGPGCSSLGGLMNIMGPYLVNEDGVTLRKNPHSWNKFSNVVYLESPAGVGFSYSTDDNITTNDDQTADENYEAVKAFFKEFPAYKKHSTFIFGESYGGVYAPMLATRILDGQTNFPIKLAGVGLGNARMLNDKLARVTNMLFAYSHGFMSETDWRDFQRDCCPYGLEDCDLRHWSDHCFHHVNSFQVSRYLNMYDIYANCSHDSDDAMEMGSPCINMTALATYLNRPEVHEALRIPEHSRNWIQCTYSPSWYTRQHGDMTSFVKKLIASDVRILLYYGDTDYMCDFLMGQKFAARLGQPLLIDKQAWFLDRQIAGFMTLYKGLTFTTIHGAGHAVCFTIFIVFQAPINKAPQMARLIANFLHDRL